MPEELDGVETPETQATTTEEPAAPQAPDFGSVLEEIRGVRSEVQQFSQQLQPQAPPEPEPEEQFDPNSLWGEGEAPASFDGAAFQAAVEAAARKIVAPVQESVIQDQRNRQFAELDRNYPELRDKKALDEVSAEVAQRAEALGDMTLAHEPAFVEQTYLAQLGRKQLEAQRTAAKEAAAANGAPLEGTTATPMQGQQSQEDLQKAVLGAGGAKNEFWAG